MEKIEVGDKVLMNYGWSISGEEVEVSYVSPCGGFFRTNASRYHDYDYPTNKIIKVIKSVDPITRAIHLLEESGYEVVAPKPKLTGKVYVHLYMPTNDIQLFPFKHETSVHKLLAIVDWTEGEGI